MTQEEKKKRWTKHIDKIVMGAIIGGAVLSVIGARKLAKKHEEKQQNLFEPKKKGLIRRLLGF